jgi:hypothetical protein
LTPGSFEILYQLILPCATLKKALTLGSNYYKIFNMAVHIQFDEDDKNRF